MPTSIEQLLAVLDKGWATLIAAALAGVISVFSLVISVLASRSQAKLAATLIDVTNICKEAREYKLKQLTFFYDPVYALLAANKAIFDRIGPTSPARIEGRFNDAETANVWQKLSEEVILPNNDRVCEIILGQLHYLASGEDESIYLEFLTHAQAYRVFKQRAYEAYTLFPFPEEILAVVMKSRADLKSSLMNVYLKKR